MELKQSIQLLNYVLLENKLVLQSPSAASTIAKHLLNGQKYDIFEQSEITSAIRNSSTVFDEVWRERNRQSWLELAQSLLTMSAMIPIPYIQIPASLVLMGQGIVGKDFTGRQLAWWERTLNISVGVLGTIEAVGLVSSAISNSRNVKILNKLDDVARIAGDHVASEIAIALRAGRISGRALSSALDSVMISKVKDFRGSFNSELKRGGNVAMADVTISGLKQWWNAHSSINITSEIKPAGAAPGISLRPTNPIFKASGVGEYARDVDTEFKILNDIAKSLGNNTGAVGKIKLFTELPPCDSCTNVIAQFAKKYKNIVIEVVDNAGTRLLP